MKTERVILSFVAVVIGLIAAGAAFYFYQLTKQVSPDESKPLGTISKKILSPTPESSNLLTLDSPNDEEVFDKKVITIKGKTRSDATIIVTSENTDQIVKPASNGTFTLSQTILNGTTILYITAVFPNGDEKTITRTVTFSTEEF